MSDERRSSDQKVEVLENLWLLETSFSAFLTKGLRIFNFRKKPGLLQDQRWCVLQILCTLPASFTGCASSRISMHISTGQWKIRCQEPCCLWKIPVLLANTEDLGNLSNVISSKQHEIFMQLKSEIKCQTMKKAVITYTFQIQALSSGDTETPATPQSQPREKWQQTRCCSQLICQDQCNAEDADVQWQKQKGKIVSYLKSNRWSMKLFNHLDSHEDQHTQKKAVVLMLSCKITETVIL